MKNDNNTDSLIDKILSRKRKYSIPCRDNDAEYKSKINIDCTDFSKFDLYKQIQIGKTAAEKFNIESPYLRRYEGIGSNVIQYQGNEYINFSSYNYLNLNNHPDTVGAIIEGMTQYGTSVSASRLVSGERSIYAELESEIADFYGVEDSIVYVSGHATNVSTISCLFGAKDLILYDAASHNSIIQGIKLSAAKAYAFKHNDTAHLESLLIKYRSNYERVLIIIEGLYSMDGDVPDLPDFVELKSKYQAFLMVDEAHSLGTLGKKGKGIFEHFGMDGNSVDIWMGTLSKTLCSCGGYIAGTSVLIEILKCHSPGFVYSVGITPMNAIAALSSLKLLQSNADPVKSIQEIGVYFLEKLKANGFNSGQSIGYGIIPLIIGGSKKTVELSNLLFDKYKINVNPIFYPAVEEKQARLRFFMNSLHTRNQIDYVISALLNNLSNG